MFTWLFSPATVRTKVESLQPTKAVMILLNRYNLWPSLDYSLILTICLTRERGQVTFLMLEDPALHFCCARCTVTFEQAEPL